MKPAIDGWPANLVRLLHTSSRNFISGRAPTSVRYPLRVSTSQCWLAVSAGGVSRTECRRIEPPLCRGVTWCARQMSGDSPDPGAPSRALERLRVVVVAHRDAQRDHIIEALLQAGFAPKCRQLDIDREATYGDALAAGPDIVLVDYPASHFQITRALECLRARGNDVPIIVVSGPADTDVAVDLMQRGAADYISTHRVARLGPAVRRVLTDRHQRGTRRQTAASPLPDHDRAYRGLASGFPGS